MINTQDNTLIDTHYAAFLLGYKSSTLIKSRRTGILGGVPAPHHIKMNGKVYYQFRIITDWIDDNYQSWLPRYKKAGLPI